MEGCKKVPGTFVAPLLICLTAYDTTLENETGKLVAEIFSYSLVL